MSELLGNVWSKQKSKQHQGRIRLNSSLASQENFAEVCHISLVEPLSFVFIFTFLIFFQESDKSHSNFNGSRTGLLVKTFEPASDYVEILVFCPWYSTHTTVVQKVRTFWVAFFI